MQRATIWMGYGLILFGWLIILNHEIWPATADEGFDVLGAGVKMTYIALATIMLGTLMLLSGREHSK